MRLPWFEQPRCGLFPLRRIAREPRVFCNTGKTIIDMMGIGYLSPRVKILLLVGFLLKGCRNIRALPGWEGRLVNTSRS